MKRKFPWWLTLILIANLLFHLIPEEWITGPVPSLSAEEDARSYADQQLNRILMGEE